MPPSHWGGDASAGLGASGAARGTAVPHWSRDSRSALTSTLPCLLVPDDNSASAASGCVCSEPRPQLASGPAEFGSRSLSPGASLHSAPLWRKSSVSARRLASKALRPRRFEPARGSLTGSPSESRSTGKPEASAGSSVRLPRRGVVALYPAPLRLAGNEPSRSPLPLASANCSATTRETAAAWRGRAKVVNQTRSDTIRAVAPAGCLHEWERVGVATAGRGRGEHENSDQTGSR